MTPSVAPSDLPTPPADMDAFLPNFDALEIFTALFAAAERVETMPLDEDGTDRVSTAGLVKVLKGGSLPPATVRASDALTALTCEPQPVANVAAALDTTPRALFPRLRALPAVTYASQSGGKQTRASMTWLETASIPPADDDAILSALPASPDAMPVRELADALDVDAPALTRHLCLLDGVYVAERDGALVVGRIGSHPAAQAR